jgi:murein DD-endopeptidase MepM/ murein hydrolase activator NlpD
LKRLKFSIKVGALIGRSFRNLILVCCLFFLLSGAIAASAATGYKISERTRIYSEVISADSVLLKMNNDLSVPVSVKLVLNLINIQDNGAYSVLAVIPAKASGYTIARFRKKNGMLPYTLNYTWKIVLGDYTKTADAAYAYSFPFLKNGNYPITQGPDGAFSHHDMFAYDFQMPMGTPVVAARDGIVALIKTDSSVGGADKAYIDDANFISVYQEDGSIANYFHLSKNGSMVEEGQRIKKGDIIGYSGNTGFTSGPHLHFEVVQPNLNTDKNVLIPFIWESAGNGYLAKIW